MTNFSRVTVAEINIFAIKNNIKDIRKKLKNNQKFCMVIKANAYGFGAEKICENLSELVDCFAVSSRYEFFKINEKTDKPIIVLDPVYNGVKELIESGAELTISNIKNCYDIINVCKKYNLKARVHIALNTGMNRFGFCDLGEIKKLVLLLEKTQNIVICGVFSHYFNANNKNYAKNQNNKFLIMKKYLEKILSLKTNFHIVASSALNFKNKYDIVRIGMSCYSDDRYETITLYSHILDIQKVRENDFIGYGETTIGFGVKRVAVVGIGYGDGLPRSIVKKGYVLINDKYCKILNICMDCLLVDATNSHAKIFDKVIVVGSDKTNRIFICDLAKWCDTIDYDIVIKLSERVERKYILEKINADYNGKI